MRIDDYQKWLDAQFIDERDEFQSAPASESVSASEPPLETAQSPADSVRFAPPIVATATYLVAPETESAPPAPVYVEPQPVSHAAPKPLATVEETSIPALDDYLPMLRSRPEPTPVSEAENLEQASTTEVPEMGSPASSEFEPEPSAIHAQPTGFPAEALRPSEPLEYGQEPAPVFIPDASRAQKARQARGSAPTRDSAPLDPDRLWNLVPKHLQVLLATGDEEVPQNSYKRQFKESRIELVSRLLDPTLSLEDTARLLNVCPTTVRRYTNKGLLTHQRTQGDQRRFKLSDVLAFLEAQSRPGS